MNTVQLTNERAKHPSVFWWAVSFPESFGIAAQEVSASMPAERYPQFQVFGYRGEVMCYCQASLKRPYGVISPVNPAAVEQVFCVKDEAVLVLRRDVLLHNPSEPFLDVVKLMIAMNNDSRYRNKRLDIGITGSSLVQVNEPH